MPEQTEVTATPPKRRTTLWVEPELLDAVQVEAARRGESMAAATRRFYRSYVKGKG